ncbi:DUF6942 family protein [Shewanella kaireitica]|uniref:DUF6942 family protein n=1 Tax=Shewanella kaireitica TaxID=212021 RepID=UPI00200D6908|nr:hypothetical protein [Shewanella kaireitica]MCL1096272.1 hypothetical protein [Shewanella kaireitica]
MIGTEHANTCFYLPTPPKVPKKWNHLDTGATQALIELNGNHWRKILTIMAKIVVNDKDWRQYRNQHLLKRDESIAIGANNLCSTAQRHIICGKESADVLNLDSTEFVQLDLQETSLLKHLDQNIYLCPYLDYRQFPNTQIDLLRQTLGLAPLCTTSD